MHVRAGGKEFGVHIGWRKYLYECTSFGYVNLWNGLRKWLGKHKKVQHVKTQNQKSKPETKNRNKFLLHYFPSIPNQVQGYCSTPPADFRNGWNLDWVKRFYSGFVQARLFILRILHIASNRMHFYFTPHLWRDGCNSFDIVCVCVRRTLPAEHTDLNFGKEVKWMDI